MKIAVVTMNVKQGKCEDNFSFMEAQIKKAIEDEAELIVFPQNAISGYLLGDRWLEDAWCHYVDSFNEKLISLSEHIAIVWGNIKYRNHRLFNAAFFAYQKQTHMRVKHNEQLAYMDDTKYFENSDINSMITFQNKTFALNFQNEQQDVDMNINLDVAPYDMDEVNSKKGNVIYVNAVGMQNCAKNIMVIQGGSFVCSKDTLLYHAPYFKEDYAIVDIDRTLETKEHKTHVVDALVLGIREFDAQVFGGKLPWVVGLSGGLDSSVTCALLAYSLGKERVYGFNMATNYNSTDTIRNAREEAKALGIHYKEGSIQSFVEASKDVFMDEYGYDTQKDSTLVLENIQARARGYLLSGFAGILGGVVVNNGNKVETILGYCTLYGDSIGAISIIGDLTKVQLFEVARDLNKRYGKEVIPTPLLPEVLEDRVVWVNAPSAELRDHQYDPMKWFYHDYIAEHLGKDFDVISFLNAYYHHELQEGELKRWISYYHLDEPSAFIKDFDWFLQTMEKNSFKRLQLPPLLSLHKKTLASTCEAQMQYDKAMYESLKEKILKR